MKHCTMIPHSLLVLHMVGNPDNVCVQSADNGLSWFLGAKVQLANTFRSQLSRVADVCFVYSSCFA